MQAIDLKHVLIGRQQGATARREHIHRRSETPDRLWITLGRQLACGAFGKPVIILRPFATGDS